jgi:parvulin-like peptidyl-prolyl isomerase
VKVLKKSSVSLLTAICVVGLLSGCSQADKNAADKATDTAEAKKTPTVTTTVAPNGQKQIKISLDTLPNDMTICTVAGKNVTIGDYRRMLKLQQVQAQQNISMDPVLRGNLLNEATKRGVTLTADEKAKLVETAKSQHKDFAAFLKEKNMTEEQFNKEVETAGIIFKMSNAAIEESLLSQVVSRALLAQASSDAASQKQAEANYEKLKAQTNNFEKLKQQTGMTDDEIKRETINAELARFQLVKLEKGIAIKDKDIQDWYNKNKGQLKHNERIRLSRIVVSAPEETAGAWVSVKDQVKKADKVVANVIQQQQSKALILLGQATAKVDFGKLANENTDDPIGRTLKNGGDMGWQEKQQLVPQFAEAVWTMSPGSVLPKLVKTNEGYSIIKVTGHEKPGQLALPEVKNAVALKLKQEKLQQEVNNWIAARQKQVKIEFAPEFQKIANGGDAPKVQ